jgi:broad specificity phosphatase PhoE
MRLQWPFVVKLVLSLLLMKCFRSTKHGWTQVFLVQKQEQYKLVETTPAKNWRTFTGAESIGELYLRAGKVLSRISDKYDEIVVIVCHGWIIDKMIAWWMGIKQDELRANMFTTANASISVLSITQFGEKVLLKLNDTTHLTHFEEKDSYLD